jgi:hypothetical protein
VLASDPGGPISLWSFSAANGIAGDDSTMFLASLGAMIMLVPLMLTKYRGKPAWKDPLRLSVLGTWILAYIATPIQGFMIEFNESSWHGTPLDLAYGSQQYFALFGLALVAASFLTVDFFQDKDRTRKTVAWFGTVIATFATLTGLAWTWFDSGALAADGSLPVTATGWVYTAGLLLVSTVLIAAVVAVYRGSPRPIPVEITTKVPVQVPMPVAKAAAPATEGG